MPLKLKEKNIGSATRKKKVIKVPFYHSPVRRQLEELRSFLEVSFLKQLIQSAIYTNKNEHDGIENGNQIGN